MSELKRRDVELLRDVARSVRRLDRLENSPQPTLEAIDSEERTAFELEDIASRIELHLDHEA